MVTVKCSNCEATASGSSFLEARGNVSHLGTSAPTKKVCRPIYCQEVDSTPKKQVSPKQETPKKEDPKKSS